MPLSKKPAIDDARIGDRKAQLAIQNIRQRLEAIEGLVGTLEAQANQTTFQLSRANTNGLNQRITTIETAIDHLLDFLAVNEGIVVAVDGQFVARTLQAGDGISIDNPDGVDGDPVINAISSGECCYPFLTDELDSDLLTEGGLRIRVE